MLTYYISLTNKNLVYQHINLKYHFITYFDIKSKLNYKDMDLLYYIIDININKIIRLIIWSNHLLEYLIIFYHNASLYKFTIWAYFY